MVAMADLDTIDGLLDELRAVPDNLDELIARYGEADRTLERLDDVLAALASGTRPRTVPPLGATPSQPPVFIPSSVRPGSRMSSRPPRAKSQPAPAVVAVAQPKSPVDYDALFGPETVPPRVPSVQPLVPALAAQPLALELEHESPALELEAEPARSGPPPASEPLSFGPPAGAEPAPSIHDTQPEPLPMAATAADSAELDAVLADAPAPAPAEAKADEEDGFEMMVEEDDILEIDGDDLEMVEDEET